MYYFFGNAGCRCDADGSINSDCDGQSGQCPCKPGVMLQDCSMCKVYHYGFSSGSGCTGNGGVPIDLKFGITEFCLSNIIDKNESMKKIISTGPLEIANQCNCQFVFYISCFFLACNCDEQGSVHMDCNNQGVCECKTNVVGDKCNQCKAGYFGRYTGTYLDFIKFVI